MGEIDATPQLERILGARRHATAARDACRRFMPEDSFLRGLVEKKSARRTGGGARPAEGAALGVECDHPERRRVVLDHGRHSRRRKVADRVGGGEGLGES
jgi:hypothetical protein